MRYSFSTNSRKGQKIVIIGNGIAGNSAALTLKNLEPSSEVTIISEEPTPLYSACVLPFYLMGKLQREQVFIRDFVQNVQMKIGTSVEEIDVLNKKVFLKEESLSYDHLILATGSRPVLPPLEGIDKKGVFAFKSITDADQIVNYPAAKAVVVGSGLVGVEVSIALRERGYEVHLVEMEGWILPRNFDCTPARFLQKKMEEQGINVFLGEKVLQILDDREQVAGIRTNYREIKCDLVIMAIGMSPEVRLAAKAGVEIGNTGGIKTDSCMKTSVENVFACGDCVESKDQLTEKAGLYMLWPNAREQGQVAAQNCLGLSRKYPGSLNVTGLDVYGMHAVSIGSTQSALERSGAEVQVVERKNSKGYLRLIISDGYLAGVQAINKTKLTGRFLNLIRRHDSVRELLTRPAGVRWIDKCLIDLWC